MPRALVIEYVWYQDVFAYSHRHGITQTAITIPESNNLTITIHEEKPFLFHQERLEENEIISEFEVSDEFVLQAEELFDLQSQFKEVLLQQKLANGSSIFPKRPKIVADY